MKINNVKVFCADAAFRKGCICIKNGVFDKITTCDADCENVCVDEIGNEENSERIDGLGCYAIPGLIDVHFHGCMGADCGDASMEALQIIADYQAHAGVTAIAPATMTVGVDELKRILKNAAEFASKQTHGADLVGLNMEGPFISRVKCGAQNPEYILPCDENMCREFLEVSNGLVKYIGLAPEENPGFEKFIENMKDQVRISLAHTNADYETAVRAIKAGASHLIHMYNAMPSLNHREPGVIAAVSDYPRVNAEIICDGIHIHPAMVRTAYRLMGAERIILVSDSLRATGMPDGIYTLGGQEVRLHGRRVTLVSNGALAGSATNLMDCMKYAVQNVGIPLEQAVASAAVNPAKSLGIDNQYGTIDTGKIANVVLLSSDLETMAVIQKGKVLSNNHHSILKS